MFLYCKQRGTFIKDFNDKTILFTNKKRIREFLIEYHSIDNDIKQLQKLSLESLLNIFDWEIVK